VNDEPHLYFHTAIATLSGQYLDKRIAPKIPVSEANDLIYTLSISADFEVEHVQTAFRVEAIPVTAADCAS